jgi:hypothetical protein
LAASETRRLIEIVLFVLDEHLMIVKRMIQAVDLSLEKIAIACHAV